MKKLAALAMVLTMAVTTLAGCSAAPAEETAASAAASQTEAAEETSVPAESEAAETESAPAEGTQAESEAAVSDGTVYQIGICQLVQHVALDAATEGFQQALKDLLGEENVEFDLQNASGASPINEFFPWLWVSKCSRSSPHHATVSV